MTQDSRPASDISICPNCATVVIYGGIGRRPIWCSTRCRNDASLKRLGARKAAVEVRVVEVTRYRDHAQPTTPEPAKHQPSTSLTAGRRAPMPTAEQALRVIRNDPVAIGSLLSHIDRRRSDGTLSSPEWLAVRNGLRLLAGGLPDGIERPS